jgi:glycosyltransferase involved in cell wall biosynthesis
MIDVVIPLYNKQEKISRCLQSVIAQKVSANKIIVIDDGSTDSSFLRAKEALSGYKGDFEIVTTFNRGVSAARNYGMSLACSEFIAFLDADDYWDSAFLENALKVLNNDQDKNIGLVTCFHEVRAESKVFVPNQGVKKSFSGIIDNYSKSAKKGNPVHSSKVVVRKDMLTKIGGFPENNGLTEDLYVWFRLSRLCKIYIINKFLVTLDKSSDPSRPSRLSMKPYILSYYLDDDAFRLLDRCEVDYLRHVYIVQSLYAIRYGDFSDASRRVAMGSGRFSFLSALLYGLAWLMSKVK